MALGNQIQTAAPLTIGVARARQQAALRAQQAAMTAEQAAVNPAAQQIVATAPAAQQAISGGGSAIAQQAAQAAALGGAGPQQAAQIIAPAAAPSALGNVAQAAAPVANVAAPAQAIAPPVSPIANTAAEAANVVPEAEAAGGKLSALKNIMSFQPRTLLGAEPLAAAEGSALPGFLQAGTLGGGLALAGGGLIGGNLVEGAIGHRNGSLDDAAADAVRGAGLGAAIGSFAPGPGTLIGGAIGGLAGGIYGLATGKDSDATEGQRLFQKELDPTHGGSFAQALSRSGMSPYAQQQLMTQLQASASFVTSKADARSLVQTAAQNIPAVLQQDQLYQQQQAKAAALQSYLGPLLEQSYGQGNQMGAQSSNLANAAASATNDPALAAAYRAQAASMQQSQQQSQQAQIAALYGQALTGGAAQQVQQAYAGAGR